ncbi:hypothetical protein RhiirA5_422311 [Rhizophagus irregularis]|uniref:MATA-HMG n=1 Tax=Rhizophagus irregularis TaxID=588596 RepID=A0A1B1EVD2_9GLOM|nr:MATA-HMG [Rhizophagus irregularis]ANQ32776.1 MATA-HMG [Rhizophagus irregularis]ANQ32777.1 MATA-HMG [Rhizophagus irregularis]PKC04400.1 hypothetical protein RhiirA5_422311 [Rhizophagus irregularis]PKC56682.1 hypothetical protein RhiirA1_473650 [Rhizophagus irregularis]
MIENKFQIEFLATSLVQKLNRKNIFPPLFNDPESFIAPAGSRPKKPTNSFLICRRNVSKEANRKGAHNMRVISKAAGILWNSATSEEKDVYKNIAERVYEIHILRSSNLVNSTSFKIELTTQPSPISHPLPFPSPSSILETTLNNYFNDHDNNQVIPFNSFNSFNYNDFDENHQWI